MSTEADWSRFTVRINLKDVTVDQLYRAWATRSGIEEWFLRTSEYRSSNGELRENKELVQPGDTYKWLWHGWSDETVEVGEILQCNGKDHFAFSFGKAGNCMVTIKEELDETIVELLQIDIPTDDAGKLHWHVGCKTGWTFYLANLKSLLEGGIDLRNRNVKLQNVLNS